MMTPQESGDLLYEKEWSEPTGRFRMTLDKNHFAVTRFFGKGSMAGTRAFVEGLDASHAVVGDGVTDVRALCDLSQLSGAPVRAQYILGKWLIGHKHQFHAIAVFGGKPWEMTLARAIARIARFRNIGFFADEPASLEFLNR